MEFCKKKEENCLTPFLQCADIGTMYSYLGFKRDSQFFIGFSVGKWNGETCDEFYKMLASRLRFPLRVFDLFSTKEEQLPKDIKPTIVLCGYNRIGYSILRDLRKVKNQVLVVDYNPETITALSTEGYHSLYGDVADEEIVDHMHLKSLTLLISTVPQRKDNLYLIRRLKSVNKKAKIIVTASDIEESLILYNHGADYVILPHFLGGEHVSELISRWRAQRIDLSKERDRHIAHLHERKGLGQNHPRH